MKKDISKAIDAYYFQGKKRLEKMLAINLPLSKSYILKESFFSFWDNQSKEKAKEFYESWKEQLQGNNNLGPLRKFAKMIDSRIDGVLNYFYVDSFIPKGYVEGVNNKVRHIINRVYGYKDKEYLYLKAIQLCSNSLKIFSPFNISNVNFSP